jgi:F0F1-type ATP synthase membrane subunit b/b'
MKPTAAIAIVACLITAGCGYGPPPGHRAEIRRAREDFRQAQQEAREDMQRARREFQRDLRDAREELRRNMEDARRDFHRQFDRR